MTQERRKFVRTIFPQVAVLEIGDRIFRSAQCHNLAMGGMCAVVEGSVEVGELGRLTLCHGYAKETINLVLGFRVIWHKTLDKDIPRTSIGIAFDSIDTENHKKLSRLMDLLLSKGQ